MSKNILLADKIFLTFGSLFATELVNRLYRKINFFLNEGSSCVHFFSAASSPNIQQLQPQHQTQQQPQQVFFNNTNIHVMQQPAGYQQPQQIVQQQQPQPQQMFQQQFPHQMFPQQPQVNQNSYQLIQQQQPQMIHHQQQHQQQQQQQPMQMFHQPPSYNATIEHQNLIQQVRIVYM